MENRAEVTSQSYHARAKLEGFVPRFISRFFNTGLRYERAVAHIDLGSNSVQIERRSMAPLKPRQPHLHGNPQGLVMRSADGYIVSRIGIHGSGNPGEVEIHPHIDRYTHPVAITFERGRTVVDARNREGSIDIIPAQEKGALIIHI